MGALSFTNTCDYVFFSIFLGEAMEKSLTIRKFANMNNYLKYIICLLLLCFTSVAIAKTTSVETLPAGRYKLETPLVESCSWWFKFDTRTGSLWKVKWNKDVNKITQEQFDCASIIDDGNNYDGRFELKYFFQKGADTDHCTFIIFDKKEGHIYSGNSSQYIVYLID